ncbi:uncharacterized protein LOC121978123 [Zingiber officinale]|uniref:Uncharacterized protein n=1 Tax=Zingiber officinale TaxID=94328 RepID=A0A8J5IE96_ZINOF|nr:uncharacterized protein LOC121978123 [Zingiber officinale]KAG6533416.1 hypothetical protein ZIOFF_007284 [Zingiber officinale]
MDASSAAFLRVPLPPSGCSAVRRASVRRASMCYCTGPNSSPPPEPRQAVGSRRQCLLLLALSSAALSSPARSEDIPLFGIKKRIKKIEEEAEEIVQEGEKAVEKGIVAAEKGIVAAEKEIQAAEGIVASASLSLAGDLLQAGAVAGAEAVGVLVSVSIVNGILAPER